MKWVNFIFTPKKHFCKRNNSVQIFRQGLYFLTGSKTHFWFFFTLICNESCIMWTPLATFEKLLQRLLIVLHTFFRSSPPRCEHPCRKVILIKLQSNWVFSSKLAAYFQNTFLREHLWRAASYLQWQRSAS